MSAAETNLQLRVIPAGILYRAAENYGIKQIVEGYSFRTEKRSALGGIELVRPLRWIDYNKEPAKEFLARGRN